MRITMTFFWFPVYQYLDENNTVFRRFWNEKHLWIEEYLLQSNTGIYNQLMLNITKQYMNKGLSGQTYEKTG